jgi:manganese/zinc/iron transport system substrate-binding protein
MFRASLLILLLFFLGCQPPEQASAGKLRVVCTTSIIADAVKQIGGEQVHVECLMGPGVDPHNYLATPGDIQKLSRAKIVFYHGLHLEGKMVDVLEKPMAGRKAVAVTASIPTSLLRRGDEGEDGHDPHVWFDPKLWASCVTVIEESLRDADSAHAQQYTTAARDYRAALEATDAELQQLAETLPKDRRVLVTSHDAFGYFGLRYGFEVKGLQGVSTASSISASDRSELAKFLVERRVPAVFTETSVPSKGLLSVLDSTKNPKLNPTGHTVKVLGESSALYSDAIGEPGSPGATYLGMIRHNMTTIVTALKVQP